MTKNELQIVISTIDLNPLINIFNEPLIDNIINNFKFNNYDVKFFLIVQKKYVEYFNNNEKYSNHVIIQVNDNETYSSSIILVKEYLDNNKSLLIANCHQILEWDPDEFIKLANEEELDGLVSVFTNNNYINEITEKKNISTFTSTGIYYWKKTSDFIKYLDQINNYNNELNLSYIYNQAINDNKKFKIHECKKYWSLKTSEDLNNFIKNYKKDDIIIAIFACATHLKYRTELNSIDESWGKICDNHGIRYLFFLGEEKTNLVGDKYVYLPGVGNDYLSATYKHWLGYKYIYDNFPETKFILMIGSDGYVDIKKILNEFINKYDYNDEIIIGSPRNEGFDRNVNGEIIRFIDGGNGYIITKATNKKLSHLYNENTINEWFEYAPQFNKCCDVAMTYYCIRNNIKIIEDEKFVSRYASSYNINDFFTIHPNDFLQFYELSLIYFLK